MTMTHISRSEAQMVDARLIPERERPAGRPWGQRVADQLGRLDLQLATDESELLRDEVGPNASHDERIQAEYELQWAHTAGLLPNVVFAQHHGLFADVDVGSLPLALARARGSTIEDLNDRWGSAMRLAMDARPLSLDDYMKPVVAELDLATEHLASARRTERSAEAELGRSRRGFGRLRSRRTARLEEAVADARQGVWQAEERHENAKAALEAMGQRSLEVEQWDQEHFALLADGVAARLELGVREERAEAAGPSVYEMRLEEAAREAALTDAQDPVGSSRIARALAEENGFAPTAHRALRERAADAIAAREHVQALTRVADEVPGVSGHEL